MRKLFSHIYTDSHSDTEWVLMKVALCLLWLDIVSHVSLPVGAVPYPAGICRYIDCSFVLVPHLPVLSLCIAILLSLLYMMERWMRWVTLSMFILSMFLFTLEESNGIYMRCGLYTAVFFAQFVAYLRSGQHLKVERVQFALQIVAAGYFLAGVSKLHESGLSWITDAPRASVQIIKNYCGYYLNSGDIHQLEKGTTLGAFITQHSAFAKFLFSCSLLLELFAWIALRHKKWAFIYGILLVLVHIGIYYFMNILVVGVFYPMLVFMINPLYLIWHTVTGSYRRLRPNPA